MTGALAVVSIAACVTGSSSAAGAASPPVGFPVLYATAHVRGFTLTVIAASGAGAGAARSAVLVDLQRNLRNGSYEDHEFEPTRRINFTMASDLSSARVSADLGRYGKVRLTARNLQARGTKGCYQHVHTGTVRGTLTLTPGGKYFKTIKRKRMTVMAGISLNCPDAGDHAVANGYAPQSINATTTSVRRGRMSLSWSAENHDICVIDLIRPGRVRVHDEISVSYPAYKLTEAHGLSRAIFVAHGPLLTGAAHYRADRRTDATDTSGTLTGTLTASFKTPGPQALTGHRFTADLSG
jgi:outer membrane protein assembly factor BamB